MANRLANETSPYLRQHAHNPVDWYPWGPEALARARAEDKPILLSIGYSACHWCHVMERESFENAEIARLMNEHFVNIKVDREERPDLDSIYMEAVQSLTGHGGWPMTMFLTPDGRPFYGGTYYPPSDQRGLPGFPRVLLSVAEAYRTRRGDVLQNAEQITAHLTRGDQMADDEAGAPTLDVLVQAARGLAGQFDPNNGGFGGAPKFPPAMALEFLLRIWRRSGQNQVRHMVELTLQKMARGGMYDQLGGGFHRYSVDAIWLVPHFEKMLYDNAQLARVYLLAYQATGNAFYRRIAEETLDYVRREMTAPSGGFYSSQDADSEGEEGKFFVWTPAEVEALLGPDADLFMRYYDVTPQGNFEGKNILHVERDLDAVAFAAGVAPEQLQALLERGRRVLFEAREQRVKPGRDEKILAAWNGLMLRAFAEAARSLDRAAYRTVAERNADFLLRELRRDGRLLRSHKDGVSKLNAYLEDYSYLIDGLLSLYEATFDRRWYDAARELADTMIAQYADDAGGGFFDTSADHERLIRRPRDLFDNATPSGNSVAAEALLRLAVLSGEPEYERRATGLLTRLGDVLTRYPSGFGRWLCALDLYLASPQEIAVIGRPESEDTRALLATIWGAYRPHKVVAGMAPGDMAAAAGIPLLADRPARDGRATAYVCEHYACQAPTTDPAELARQLG